jgi:two-component system, OmpR family, alkaline phosphatase synthesis response regulator PhoP
VKIKNQFKGSKILVVEDEETLAIGLEYNLSLEGYEVARAADGRKALALFKKQSFDLVVLDLMLPYVDGFELAQQMRKKSPQIPILILTARKTAVDRVRGLSLGADDYLTKPFHLEELILRIQGMLRRKSWYKATADLPSVYQFGDNEVNFENLSCRSGKHRFQITPQEAAILKYLIVNRGKIVSRKELLENVWHMNATVETRTIDNFIVRLRKYFEPKPDKPVFFTSVRSAGYMFTEE